MMGILSIVKAAVGSIEDTTTFGSDARDGEVPGA
jgi:hypothetical protein